MRLRWKENRKKPGLEEEPSTWGSPGTKPPWISCLSSNIKVCSATTTNHRSIPWISSQEQSDSSKRKERTGKGELGSITEGILGPGVVHLVLLVEGEGLGGGGGEEGGVLHPPVVRGHVLPHVGHQNHLLPLQAPPYRHHSSHFLRFPLPLARKFRHLRLAMEKRGAERSGGTSE